MYRILKRVLRAADPEFAELAERYVMRFFEPKVMTLILP